MSAATIAMAVLAAMLLILIAVYFIVRTGR